MVFPDLRRSPHPVVAVIITANSDSRLRNSGLDPCWGSGLLRRFLGVLQQVVVVVVVIVVVVVVVVDIVDVVVAVVVVVQQRVL